jgi:hypothetical protein
MIGAMIAPTDAALGAAVISNPRVPERIRQALDIESGLNDGVSLPFLLIFMALASESSGKGVAETFLREIGIAVLVGVIVGAAVRGFSYALLRLGGLDPRGAASLCSRSRAQRSSLPTQTAETGSSQHSLLAWRTGPSLAARSSQPNCWQLISAWPLFR